MHRTTKTSRENIGFSRYVATQDLVIYNPKDSTEIWLKIRQGQQIGVEKIHDDNPAACNILFFKGRDVFSFNGFPITEAIEKGAVQLYEIVLT